MTQEIFLEVAKSAGASGFSLVCLQFVLETYEVGPIWTDLAGRLAALMLAAGMISTVIYMAMGGGA